MDADFEFMVCKYSTSFLNTQPHVVMCIAFGKIIKKHYFCAPNLQQEEMSKNKLQKFADMQTFTNVFQCSAADTDLSVSNPLSGNWRQKVFGNDHPIVLELGCGRGEYTVGMGQLFPEKNFIGIDIKGARMWAGAKQAQAEGLKNVAFLRTNIEFVERFFSSGEVDEIWITFPDPQMKKATKRLTSTYFLQRYRKILVNNGAIHLKTDSPFLYQYTLEMLQKNLLPTIASTADLYAEDFSDRILSLKTHYEKQWLDRGMKIKYLCFALPHEGELEEPEVEIERDTYRSYGRNYNAPQS